MVTNESIVTAAGKTQVKPRTCLAVWLLLYFGYGFTTNWAELLQQLNDFCLQKIPHEKDSEQVCPVSIFPYCRGTQPVPEEY